MILQFVEIMGGDIAISVILGGDIANFAKTGW